MSNYRCVPFTEENFTSIVSDPTRRPGKAPPTQVRYLAGYLTTLNAKTLLIEEGYIDRHFVEEFSFYYSRCLVEGTKNCVRVHAFRNQFDDDQLDDWLAKLRPSSLSKELNADYLGFVVVRPIPSVPIGRTALAHMTDEPRRSFPTAYDSTVHLLGLSLEVCAIPFQQQDLAVAACATTAIWTALNRVCRRDGARAPTPSEISQAAVTNFIPTGRPFPSGGLTRGQMYEAFRAYKYPPESLPVGKAPTDFLINLNTYLRSGIPVVLMLTGKDPHEGHAVAAVGYRRTEFSVEQVRKYETADGGCIYVGHDNLAMSKIYVHDDRLGPYARATLHLPNGSLRSSGLTAREQRGEPAARKGTRSPLEIEIEYPGGRERSNVLELIAPLYPKLRTSANELYSAGVELSPILERLFCIDGGWITWEVYFARSGTYLAGVSDLVADRVRVPSFVKSVQLSRYLGVIRVGVAQFNGEHSHQLDVLVDTTDRIRYLPEQIRGLVTCTHDAYEAVQSLRDIGIDRPIC